MNELSMNDAQLIHRLRGIDTPIEPSPRFADELFGTLTLQRQREKRRRLGFERPQLLQMAAASLGVLLVVAVGWALLASPRGPAVTPPVLVSPTPDVEPTAIPTESLLPSPTPLFPAPSPDPTPSVLAGAWEPGAQPPLPIAAFLDSNDGLVWAFGFAEEPAPYTPNEIDLMAYDATTNEWMDHGRVTYEAVGLDPNLFPGVIGPDGDVYLFGSPPAADEPPVVWRIDGETLVADGTGPEVSSPTVTPEIAPDGNIYVLDTFGADMPTWQAQRLWTYDPVADAFEQLPPIPEDRVSAMLVGDGAGGVYVIGGTTVPEFTRPDTAEASRLNTTFRYDTVLGEWAESVTLPSPAGTDLNLAPYTNLTTLGSDGALYLATAIETQRMQRLAAGSDEWTVVDFPIEITGQPSWVGVQGIAAGALVLVGTPDQVLVAAVDSL